MSAASFNIGGRCAVSDAGHDLDTLRPPSLELTDRAHEIQAGPGLLERAEELIAAALFEWLEEKSRAAAGREVPPEAVGQTLAELGAST